MVGWWKRLGIGILCSCSCLRRSGHNVPVNLQRDKCYSLFCNFLSLCECKRVIPLKGQRLENGLPVYFRLWVTFFPKKVQSPAWLSTGHRAQKLDRKRNGCNVESVLLFPVALQSAAQAPSAQPSRAECVYLQGCIEKVSQKPPKISFRLKP